MRAVQLQRSLASSSSRCCSGPPVRLFSRAAAAGGGSPTSCTSHPTAKASIQGGERRSEASSCCLHDTADAWLRFQLCFTLSALLLPACGRASSRRFPRTLSLSWKGRSGFDCRRGFFFFLLPRPETLLEPSLVIWTRSSSFIDFHQDVGVKNQLASA